MPIEKKPLHPIPPSYRPKDSKERRVLDGDDWWKIAAESKMDVWDLIEFNFKTRTPSEVNYYLRTRVGCNKATRDGKNWMFSTSAKPGIIFIPSKQSQPSRVWFGIAGKEGGTLGIAGKETAEGWLISADDYHNRCWFNLDAWRLGLGLGASAGAAIVIVTSMEKPMQLNGHAVTGFDFQANMGAKWGTVAKWLTGLEKYGRLAKAGMKVGKKIISAAEWEKTREAIKSAASALGMKFDAYVPQVNILDLPGAGIGLEISAYGTAGEFRVHGVQYRQKQQAD